MHPLLFELTIGSRSIPLGTYGVMMVIAIAVGIILFAYVAGKRGKRRVDYFFHGIFVAAAGLAGAMIAGAMLFPPRMTSGGLWEWQPVMVSWGGIIGGFAALVVLAVRFNENIFDLLDNATPSYLIGIGIGRVGCFFGGCCYGIHSSSWGVTFTDPLAPAHAAIQPLVPVQLISAVFCISAGIVFLSFAVRRSGDGSIFGASALTYAAFRFTIEFFRDDPRRFLYGLSDGQIFSVAFAACGLAILARAIARRGNKIHN